MQLHQPAPPVPKSPLRQVFPFGRGGRGTRQRVMVEFGTKGGDLRLTEVSVNVVRTQGVNLTLVKVGVSMLRGKFNRVFFVSQVSEGFKATVQAVKDFRTVRHNNKLWAARRKKFGGTGKEF